MATAKSEEASDTSKVIPITEGAATILFASENEAFYNPVQQFNRDLSILGIRAWSKTFIEEKRAKAERYEAVRAAKKRKMNHGNGTTSTKIATEKASDVATVHASVEIPNVAPVDTSHAANAEPSTVTDGAAEWEEILEEPITSNGGAKSDTERPICEPKFSILEALSATGLRAIRYAKEIPHLAYVVANDLSFAAVEQIKHNSSHNQTNDLVRPNQGDARSVMYNTKQRYNVIDLDPYGSAVPFLDAAVQAVEDGGLLVVTCTDLAVLAGDAHPEKCWSLYGGITLKQSDFCHEQALRMVINSIAVSAGRYGRAITPLLSLSIDFYVRLFIRVETRPVKVKLLMSNTMLTYQCSGCKTFTNQPMGVVKPGNKPDIFKFSNASPSADHSCAECGYTQHIGGPMYSGPLHDHKFIDQILEYADESENALTNYLGTIPRIKGMLHVAKEELTVPHHWSIAKMTGILHCESPPYERILSAIVNAGYEVSGSHTGPRSIKTNAPASFMWDVMRAWILEKPIREESIKEQSPGANILKRREPKTPIDFTFNPKAKSASKAAGLVRYQQNPTANWGPKSKAAITSARKLKQGEKRQHSGE